MRVTIEHWNRFKNALSLKTESTQETYLIFVSKFLEFCDFNLTRDGIIQFMSTVPDKSKHTAYYAIKFFYKVNEEPVPVKAGDVTPKGVVRLTPSLIPEEVEALVKTVKDKYGTIEIGYMALVTIYGCRRKEIWQMKASDIDIDSMRFIVHTLKGGVEREHIIPDELTGVFHNLYDGLKKVKRKPSVQMLNFWFDRLCVDAGVPLRPRLGLHSVRRALETALVTVPVEPTMQYWPLYVRHFTRWKPRNPDIMQHYIHLTTDMVDPVIFKYHPFLKFWRNET